MAGLAAKRYPLSVVSEGANLSANHRASAPADDRRGRLMDERSRLQKLLTKQLRSFTALFAQVLAEEDADAVHDLRVCTRRVQQILATLAPEKSLNKARSIRRTLRRVRRALGPWRNADVALQMIRRKQRRISKETRKRGWNLVHESIAAERERAIARARRKLYKSEGITLSYRIGQLLALAPVRLGSVDAGAVVRSAVAGAFTQWREALERAQAERSLQNIHALRIQTKRLRYRVELARDLGALQAQSLIQWFKLLQDRLGHWHDRQELSRFITRALAASDTLIEEPRVAVELLKEVERDIKVSSRDVDELLRLASQSDGARRLDEWVRSYCIVAGPEGNGMAASAPPPQEPDREPLQERPKAPESE